MALSTIKLNICSDIVRANFVAHLETLEVLFAVPNGGSAVVMQYYAQQAQEIFSEVKPELMIYTGYEGTASFEFVTKEDLEELRCKSPVMFENVVLEEIQ